MASERISVDKLAKVARLELEQELLATEKWQAQILLEQVFHTNESELAGPGLARKQKLIITRGTTDPDY